jgi:luciferase family oxidoreductase group 1
MTRLSILDLCPIVDGDDTKTALHKTVELAKEAERLGFARFWVSEHHNMAGTASAATSIIIGQVAAATSTINVGSGGVMLPNHSPYVIAEQFGTLEAYYPGRIDLGLGRSPGTDMNTIMALRRDPRGAERFANDLQELKFFLQKAAPNQAVRAIPGEDTNVPIWILGSSTSSAALAAANGFAFVFASHVTPNGIVEAARLYRERFQPSPQLSAPYFMPCVNAFAADTDEQARYHFSSLQRGMVNFFRGSIGAVQRPIDDIEALWRPEEKRMIEHMNTLSLVGSAATVEARLRALIEATGADEVMLSGNFHDREAKLRSLEIFSSLDLERLAA